MGEIKQILGDSLITIEITKTPSGNHTWKFKVQMPTVKEAIEKVEEIEQKLKEIYPSKRKE